MLAKVIPHQHGDGLVGEFGKFTFDAVAAFTQALEARSQWFDRAANNLALAEGKQ